VRRVKTEASVGTTGITAAGSFIIDHIKVVDVWPEEGMLALIMEERRASGGCAYNVLMDIARLRAGIPLRGIGLISNDADGRYIVGDLKSHGIDGSMMRFMDGVATPYTDVITIRRTGNRTFFHNKGTSRFLDVYHFDFAKISSKIFHIGYLLLLDALDGPDPEFGTVMARLLKKAKESGLKTSVDVVSESSYRFNKIVLPALKYTDYLILNEIEAGRTTGHEIRGKSGKLDAESLKGSLESLVRGGESELVCIHFPEGAFAAERGQKPHYVPSYQLPDGFIKGTAGAGDAFCAGMLFGMHEGWDLDRSMRFSAAMAAMCLTDMTTSEGMKAFGEVETLMNELPLRETLI
jgi:sugar/nucleoside kinase (ribokinase family)